MKNRESFENSQVVVSTGFDFDEIDRRNQWCDVLEDAEMKAAYRLGSSETARALLAWLDGSRTAGAMAVRVAAMRFLMENRVGDLAKVAKRCGVSKRRLEQEMKSLRNFANLL